MMGFARPILARRKEIIFWKLFGSGVGEGFTPLPNTSVYALLTTYHDRGAAHKSIKSDPLILRYRKRAVENWTVFLEATSARGRWSGTRPFDDQAEPDDGPIVALTRATIKPHVLFKFWSRVPKISQVIGSDPNVLFKIGIGEVPWFHQVTFSIWPDLNSMAEFARRDGPHARAIDAVRKNNWFKEELYARFNLVDELGDWADIAPMRTSKMQEE